jgi:signal recognition particle subunit SRP54
MHRGMADMMKMMGNGPEARPDGRACQHVRPWRRHAEPTPEQIEALQKQMGGAGGLPEMPAELTRGIPAMPPGLPGLGKPGLPGLGGKLPGLGGFNPFGGKKK